MYIVITRFIATVHILCIHCYSLDTNFCGFRGHWWTTKFKCSTNYKFHLGFVYRYCYKYRQKMQVFLNQRKLIPQKKKWIHICKDSHLTYQNISYNKDYYVFFLLSMYTIRTTMWFFFCYLSYNKDYYVFFLLSMYSKEKNQTHSAVW